MDFSEYQMKTKLTAVYPGQGAWDGVLYTTLGLSGEAGELCNKLKKVMRDNQNVLDPERRARLLDELGDVLWYVAALATELHCDFNELAENNLAKLANRFANDTIHGSGDSR